MCPSEPQPYSKMETTETQITVIEEVTALTVFDRSKVDELINRIRKEATSLVADITTQKGRDQLKSQAYKVSQSKQHLIKLANASIEKHREIVNGVTRERRRLEDELDRIRDEVKAPAVEWEAREQARLAELDRMLQIVERSVADHVSVNASFTSVAADFDSFKSIFKGFDWQEYAERGSAAYQLACREWSRLIESLEKREAEQAELNRLREAEEKRKAEEEASKAEQARKDAEAQAAKETAEREERRKQDELRRIEQAKADAVRQERERIEADLRKKAEAEALRAAEEGRKRQREELAEARRKADQRHRAQVRGEAAEAISKLPNRADSCAIISAIEDGKIPHVTINF